MRERKIRPLTRTRYGASHRLMRHFIADYDAVVDRARTRWRTCSTRSPGLAGRRGDEPVYSPRAVTATRRTSPACRRMSKRLGGSPVSPFTRSPHWRGRAASAESKGRRRLGGLEVDHQHVLGRHLTAGSALGLYFDRSAGAARSARFRLRRGLPTATRCSRVCYEEADSRTFGYLRDAQVLHQSGDDDLKHRISERWVLKIELFRLALG